MKITIAICTWNRAPLLQRTLDQLTQLDVPARLDWELLVVNNGCTDETDTILREFAGRLPLTRLFEPKLGLSNARNCAVAAATGDYILWTDDDVLVDAAWLTAYHAGFARFPDAVLFGGAVRPDFAAPPPDWLVRAWPAAAVHYAMRESPHQPQQIAPDYVPFGANYALRMDVQRRHPYDARLGRKGELLYSGEECEVMWAVLREGGVGWWLPDAPVLHRIAPERLSTAYLRRLLHCEGEIDAAAAVAPNQLRVFGRPLTLWKKVVSSELRYRLHRAFSKPEVWFTHFREASLLQGQFRGWRF